MGNEKIEWVVGLRVQGRGYVENRSYNVMAVDEKEAVALARRHEPGAQISFVREAVNHG